MRYYIARGARLFESEMQVRYESVGGRADGPRARFLPPPSLPRLARDKVVDIFRPAAAEMLRGGGQWRAPAGTSDQPPHGT